MLLMPACLPGQDGLAKTAYMLLVPAASPLWSCCAYSHIIGAKVYSSMFNAVDLPTGVNPMWEMMISMKIWSCHESGTVLIMQDSYKMRNLEHKNFKKVQKKVFRKKP